MYELIYTSTPQGLITGRSGFTTVAMTAGFPPNLIGPVENLSGYKPLYPPGHEHEGHNPVSFSCQAFSLGSTRYTVLSRISYAGLSYTGRSNVLAHHLLFTPEELDEIPGGAVSVLRAEENFPGWSGNPRMLPEKRIRDIKWMPPPQGGEMWQKMAGDSRWAEYTADCFRSAPEKGLFLAFDPLQFSGDDILALIAETAARLNKAELRKFAFSTYSYSSGISNPLFFRSYVYDSVLLNGIKRLDPGSIIDLGKNNTLPGSWKKSVPDEDVIYMYPREEKLQVQSSPETPVSANLQIINPGTAPGYGGQNGYSGSSSAGGYDPGRQQAYPEGTQKEEEIRSNVRKYIVITSLLCLIALMISAVVWKVSSESKMVPADESGKIISIDSESTEDPAPGAGVVVPESGKTVSETAKSRRENKKPAGGVELKKVQQQKKKKTGSAVKKPARNKAEAVFGDLSNREIFELYRNFYSGKGFFLPGSLKQTMKLELQLRPFQGNEYYDLRKFVSGNGSRSVTVYPRRRKISGMSMELVPDQNNSAMKMSFTLKGSFLQMELPSQSSDFPRLTDAARISFISGTGKRYDFKPAQIPDCITEMLQGKYRIDIDRSKTASCRVILTITDDLWVFRDYYNISCNGKILGNKGIPERRIPLKEIDLNFLQEHINQRNSSLSRYLNAKHICSRFELENRKDLVPPVLKSEKTLEKIASSELVKKLKQALKDEDEETVEKCTGELEKKLNAAISSTKGKGKISAEECEKLKNEVAGYLESYGRCNRLKRDLKKLLNDREKYRKAYQNDYNVFLEKVKSKAENSYRKIQKMDFYAPLDFGKCSQMICDELSSNLERDMKIKFILRKDYP